MTAGLHTTNLANVLLNVIKGTTPTPPSATWVKLHTGDPGSAGTSNASANTTRSQASFANASSGALALTGTAPSWASWASGSETLTHFSVWDASSAGNFLFSGAFTSSKAVANGDTVTQSTLGVALSPLAA
jgi:hypothetical protein